jgi:UDP-N-acetylglucosamine diphosphorylase / glucose-1-phosphate thymidylyltransferase / UDP-N-acetylgalactosamine diphosphorylase / glucosamine-1-phosphate N-acetyltransferase / galactosamine-1-phosphate N-acetyltransferase
MKAVILAAGSSTRTYPLTLTRPKPLLPIMNKPLLAHTLEHLKDIVSEVILIVGYKKEMIKEYFGNKFRGISIQYVDQEKQMGTGHALMQAKDFLKGKFLVLNGDDIYHKKDIKSLLPHKYCLCVSEVDNPKMFGVIDPCDNTIKRFLERPKHPPSNLVNTGLYMFHTDIFRFALKKTKRGEFEIVDYVNHIIRQDIPFHYEIIKEYWIPIGYPWQVITANEFLTKRIKNSKIDGKVEKGVVIKGPVLVGKGTVLKSGTYIEGPVVIGKRCTIGPNCYIRSGTVLGDECKVGNACEVKNSTFFRHAVAGHLSYIGDSVIGENVNLGAGTITANLRHDNKNIKSSVRSELIDTGRRKFGTIIADGVHTGIHTSLYPGRKLFPNTSTVPGESVTKDKEE